MGRLTKDAWAKPSLKTKEVEVEDLGGSVLVRELPASFAADINQHIQMKQIGREQISSVDLKTMERMKFAYGVIDDEGNPVFTEDEASDIASKHGRTFKVVIDAIDELSALDQKGLEAAEARFPSGGVRKNGGPVPDPSADRVPGPDLRARTGA